MKGTIAALGTLTMLAGTARADQCAWITKDLADNASKFVAKGDSIAELCEPCGDTAPKITKVAKVEVAVPSKGFFELRVNGNGVDLAYVYIRDKNGKWSNLGLMVGCGAQGVTTTLSKGP